MKKKSRSSRARKYIYFEKNGRFYMVRAPRARPSGYSRHPRQQAPGNERPYPNSSNGLGRKSKICLPYLRDYQDYSEWVEFSRLRRSRRQQTSVSLHTKKHTPRHALASPSGRVDEKPSSLPTHQLPSSLTSLPVRTRRQLSSSLMFLPVRIRYLTVNVNNNNDCGKTLRWVSPSAPAAQEDQVKLHKSGDAITPLQDEKNIVAGSGNLNTGLTTLEGHFEDLEIDWPATDENPTSREYALATEVEVNFRNTDLSDGEDIE